MEGSAEISVPAIETSLPTPPKQPAVQAESQAAKTEQPVAKTEQPATEQSEQPAVNQSEQSTTQLSGEESSQLKDESNEPKNPQQYIDQLPEHIRKNFLDENGQPRLPEKIDGITPGQREVATLVLLEWIAQEGTLPPGLKDPKKNVLTIVFGTNHPEIEINDSTKKILEITKVEGDNFVCKLAGQEEPVVIAAIKVIEAQKKIVEESEGTGIVKASALRTFLERARDELSRSQPEGQPLSQADQLVRINDLITSLESQLSPDQATFFQALSLVLPSQQPAIQEQINKIESLLTDQNLSDEQKQELEKQKAAFQQILAIFQQQSEELITQWVQKVYSEEFSTEEIDKINDLLETGNIDSIQELLGEKDGDSEDIKQAKDHAASVIRGLKEKAPIVGGISGILLLLMILKASKTDGGQG